MRKTEKKEKIMKVSAPRSSMSPTYKQGRTYLSRCPSARIPSPRALRLGIVLRARDMNARINDRACCVFIRLGPSTHALCSSTSKARISAHYFRFHRRTRHRHQGGRIREYQSRCRGVRRPHTRTRSRIRCRRSPSRQAIPIKLSWMIPLVASGTAPLMSRSKTE